MVKYDYELVEKFNNINEFKQENIVMHHQIH
jgi:hypothetical protein